MVTHVIKSSQTTEPYNEVKLSKSITKALISAHYPKDKTKQTTSNIINELQTWLQSKSQVTSLDIRTHVASLLEKYDHETALIYKKHKDLW